jgi:hexosaminidase
VDDAYNWNPDSLVAGLDRNGIIGVEAPIWGETLRDFKDAEFLLFPRTPGIAEVAWSTGERKWDEYRVRLGRHGKTMDELGINYYKSPKVDWAATDPAASRQ